MENKLIKSLVAVFIIFATFYLFASFVTMSFNPNKWESDGRFVTILFSLFFGIVAIAFINKDKN